MGQYEFQDADFDAMFNPDDISKWKTDSPHTVMENLARSIFDENKTIAVIADMVLNDPNIKLDINTLMLDDEHSTKSLKDIMEDIMRQVHRTNRIVATLKAYADAELINKG